MEKKIVALFGPSSRNLCHYKKLRLWRASTVCWCLIKFPLLHLGSSGSSMWFDLYLLRCPWNLQPESELFVPYMLSSLLVPSYAACLPIYEICQRKYLLMYYKILFILCKYCRVRSINLYLLLKFSFWISSIFNETISNIFNNLKSEFTAFYEYEHVSLKKHV